MRLSAFKFSFLRVGLLVCLYKGPASYDAQWCIKIGVKFIEHWCHGVLFLILLLTDINSPYWLSVVKLLIFFVAV